MCRHFKLQKSTSEAIKEGIMGMEDIMDIWQKLYLKAKEQYCPKNVLPFIYAHNVVCALESENG